MRDIRANLAQAIPRRPANCCACWTAAAFSVAFDLPWPWVASGSNYRGCGVEFHYRSVGSGKTRLARCLAETLPTPSSWVSIGWNTAAPRRGRNWTATRRSNPGSIRA